MEPRRLPGEGALGVEHLLGLAVLLAVHPPHAKAEHAAADDQRRCPAGSCAVYIVS